ncbi:tetratricopeptide repeat protein [Halothiobacillus sp.]|uniref:tetratricopeptide repeat protein n=1 Tax=Halothiobacillus sp. TaxID=1891311 RepID=UPI002AD25081|nr:tetratricopeptide repeat protein [Halothiobacillus sp.]
MTFSPIGFRASSARPAICMLVRLGRLAIPFTVIGLLAGCASAPPMQTAPVPTMKQPPIPPSVQAHPLIMPTISEQDLPAPNGGMSRGMSGGMGMNAAPMQAVPTASAPAVHALIVRAEQQTKAGDLGGAEATLERAVQIQPHDPRLWMDFAQLRLAQNQAAEAEQFALRAVQYAGTNQELSSAWIMVAKTRDAQGNIQGAAEARRKAGSQSPPANQTQG